MRLARRCQRIAARLPLGGRGRISCRTLEGSMVSQYQVIGNSAPRVEGIDKVTGKALYTADFSPPGTIWGKALHSPYAHARILSIDTTAAKALPGVHAVITGRDVAGGMYGRAIKDIPVLALDRVRFFGERIAAVAADDEDIAQRALDLIEIEYEELPAVFDPLEALEPSAPVLHDGASAYQGMKLPEGAPPNAYSVIKVDRGDIEAGFAEADVIVENTYHLPRVHQVYLEPQSVLIWLDGERVQVWTCSKAPYNTREALATAAQIPEESVVFNPTLIGGDFGGKATPSDLPICYFLARASGRPVRMILDYTEELMAANPRHEVVVQLKSGVKHDGTLTARQVRFLVNSGAYAGYKPAGIIRGSNQAAGPYKIANTRLEGINVYTNTVPGGHMRAPGEPQAFFAVECHTDEVAKAIGMDPLQFRLLTLVEEGEETAFGEVLQDVLAKQTLMAAAEAAGYYSPKAPNVGRGIGIGDRPPGGGQGTADVTLRPDGTVLLTTGVFEQGSGTYTTFRQVISEELQIDPERVEIEVQNTDYVKMDSGLGGSRGTRIYTTAAYDAAQAAKTELIGLASRQLEWPEDKIAYAGDEVRRTDTGESVRWADLLARSGDTVSGRGHIQDSARPHFTSFTAQIAEVSVDPETGEVKLLSFTTAHDVGKIINPISHQGQINGGVMQGIGYALMEELRVEDGRVTTLSLGDYKVPTIRDIPPMKTVLVQSESGVGPYQIKGIGETPIGPVAPAIANAVADAIGVRVRDLPVTAEKVFQALKEAKA
ncbi:MAG: molybdopterin-dependent oxidoreductase [Dehalococcoidia bacterium]|nr:molybdopterin-dependent oxidoreductase [Dehalococcoidia bacterium]